MNSVYFPVQIVVLFRRLFDAISVISSKQYTLLTRKKSRVEESGEARSTSIPVQQSRSLWRCISSLEWSWWALQPRKPHFKVLEADTALLGRHSAPSNHRLAGVKAVSDTLFPWSGTTWPWVISKLDETRPAPTERTSSQQATSPHERYPGSDPDPDPDERRADKGTIQYLLQNPALRRPTQPPRHPIVLCHGLYGFDVLGPTSFPSLRLHYWSGLLSILKEKVGAEVIVTSVPPTGSIASRSETLHRQLQERAKGREVNLLAHSMGGLDCRHLISHIKPQAYVPASLTTVSTPHRGSPFMDWCVDNIGIGKLRGKEKGVEAASDVKLLSSSPPPSPANHPSQAIPPKPDTHFPVSLSALPSSFTTFLLSTVDSPAYANLTTSYLTRVFNPITPNDPRVRYFSIAGRVPSVSIWHPLWLPKMVMDGVERRTRQMLKEEWEREREPGVRIDGSTHVEADEKPLWARDDEWGNDGLVTVQSARWGEFLGTLEGCDHWTMRGARGIELNMDFHLRIARSGSGNGGEGWRFIDWGRFAGVRKREGKTVQAMADDGRRRVERDAEDASVKSSTDKLSAVFDWLVEQVPVSGKGKAEKEGELSEERRARKTDRDTKTDLEKVYVALSSKLYDEGL